MYHSFLLTWLYFTGKIHLMNLFDKILDWFVPEEFKDDYERNIKAKIVVGNGLIWGILAGSIIGTTLY